MTSVCFVKDIAGRYISFESTGHSGYAEEGSDIVCAAVSAATELVIGILERFSVDIELNINAEKAEVKCVIKDIESNIEKEDAINRVLDGYYGYISDISKEYPKHLKCNLTETKA